MKVYQTVKPCYGLKELEDTNPILLIEHLGPHKLTSRGDPIILALYREGEDGWERFPSLSDELVEVARELLVLRDCD